MEDLDEATLFVAATRPALLLGLPFGVVVLFLVALGLIMVILENPFYELFLIPLWFVARQLTTAHWFDITAARRDLGFVPQTTLEQALQSVATV